MWEAEGATPCTRVCPLGDGGCLDGRIENGRLVERRYDAARCTSRVYTHWIPGFQKGLELALDQEDPEARKMVLYSSHFTKTLWSMTYAAQSQVLGVHAGVGRHRSMPMRRIENQCLPRSAAAHREKA